MLMLLLSLLLLSLLLFLAVLSAGCIYPPRRNIKN